MSNFPDSVATQLGATNKNYGQNQFGGPSSDNPGKRTASGFLPDPGTPVNDQLRKVPSGNVPPAFGMKKRS